MNTLATHAAGVVVFARIPLVAFSDDRSLSLSLARSLSPCLPAIHSDDLAKGLEARHIYVDL